ncbi:general odorant-binding protein 69a-like [Trichogramma pretiosum]|uniref:general odorant-binding protein 69a-like n=1 Tax=Trichogramma pretiosum TaxID=7493 RepID=UPI0006C959EB|nr:general odorant-binding protein 69a-like [Trichogramma pretiosum]
MQPARVFSALAAILTFQALVVYAKRPEYITDEIMDMISNDKNRCMAEYGTTEALIDQVNDGHIPNDRAITCYMYCMFESFSLVDEDGEIEIEMLVGFIPEEFQEIAAELIEACATLPGEDVCDKMYKRSSCVQAKRPDLWFMV